MSVKSDKPDRAAQRPRLGRGLSSLISVSDLPVEAEISVPTPLPPHAYSAQPAQQEPPRTTSPTELPIDQVRPNPHQPRKTWNEMSLAELAASIRSTGLIQPIIVRKLAEGFELVAGERRLRAAKLAGLSAIPAIVREMDSAAQAQAALIENIQREDLNPIERALGYRTLMSELGLTQNELASRLGQERSSVANFLRLLDLAQPVQTLIRESKLSLGHGKLIAGVADILEQERLANLVVTQDLSVRNLERLLSQAPKAPPPPRQVQSPHIADLEKTITRQLGMKTQVRSSRKKGKGRLVIHYATLDEFDQLLAKLGVKTE